MKIELLYLMDCPYCLKTKKLLKDVTKEFDLGIKIKEILIDSDVKAKKHKFIGSPTVRIDGKDIQEIVTKQVCPACSEISGKCTTCRTYLYKRKSYPFPPKKMIREAIKKFMVKK